MKRVEVDIDKYSLDGKVNDAISYLTSLLNTIPEEYRDSLSLSFDAYDYYGSTTYDVEAYYYWPYTKEELKAINDADKAKKARQIEQLKAQLERLSK